MITEFQNYGVTIRVCYEDLINIESFIKFCQKLIEDEIRSDEDIITFYRFFSRMWECVVQYTDDLTPGDFNEDFGDDYKI